MAVRTRAWLGASSRLAIRPKPQLSRSYELLQREGDGASIVRCPQASAETGEPLARTPARSTAAGRAGKSCVEGEQPEPDGGISGRVPSVDCLTPSLCVR